MEACKNFGGHIGTAFQLTDDLLDYYGTESDIGKKLGDDLREGKATLPLLRLMSTADKKTAEILRKTIVDPNDAPFGKVANLIKKSDAINYTKKKVINECQSAEACLSLFEDSSAKEELIKLVFFVHSRKS